MFDVSRYQSPGQLNIAEGLLSRKKDALLPVGIHSDFKKDRSATEPAVLQLVPKPLDVSMIPILSDKITTAIQRTTSPWTSMSIPGLRTSITSQNAVPS
jgi:hypothetical protein